MFIGKLWQKLRMSVITIYVDVQQTESLFRVQKKIQLS